MNIEFEFNFKQTYYYNKLASMSKIEKCLFCDEGKIKRNDDKIVTCPICNGNGEVESGGSIIEEPRNCYLSSIKITSDKINYVFCNEFTEIIHASIYNNINDCIIGKSR